jgi:hypothetical protein
MSREPIFAGIVGRGAVVVKGDAGAAVGTATLLEPPLYNPRS